MKSHRLIGLILVIFFTLSGCASNSFCKSAYDIVDGTVDNYADRQERESRDINRLNDDRFKDQDLVAGLLTAGIRGVARLFESNSKKKTTSTLGNSQCPRT